MKNYLYLILFILISLIACDSPEAQDSENEKVSVGAQNEFILDADTGNEMDDLYAIVRCLIDNEVKLTALTSAHFNNTQLLTDSLWHIYPTAGINTVKISQDINEDLLKDLDREEVPHPVGADRILGYAWGFYEGAPIPESPAIELIVEEALNHSPEDKLNIICLGAVTNVASAILQEPKIADNIRLYALTMKYNEEYDAWNKNSFNARNDINALDQVLSNERLELFVIPGNVSRTLTFNRQETLDKLSRWDHPAVETLAERWDEVNAGDSWIMWDLALVEAAIHPYMATIERIPAPPENGGREIFVYTDIDEEAIRDKFWEIMKSYFDSGL
jgi:inosine-uridine nucleoside N-ribohydrolase